MRKLRALEDVLIRVESALAVVLVLTMLLLAAYNVVYRNVLVPLQNHWAHSGPPVQPAASETAPAEVAPPSETKVAPTPAPVDSAREGEADDIGGRREGQGQADEGKAEPANAAADDFGGFGGGLGEEDEGAPEAKAAPAVAPEAKAVPATPAADDFGGFGGGLDDEPEEPAAPPAPKAPEPAKVAVAEPAKPASDDFGGFGGGLGDEDDEDDEAEPEPPKTAGAEPAKPASDDFGGFGGGLGEEDDGGETKASETKASETKATDTKTPPAADALDEDASEDDFGEDDLGDDDQFANLPDIDAVAKQSSAAVPQGGPPPPGSFAAWAVQLIDDIKLDWIDLFLRQLVIIVAFFGAMLATQRGKHINVDALSKLLPTGVRRVVGVIMPLTAVAVCIVLAKAGWDLVTISRQYPRDLLPSVPEWTLQLMFPVGFGLLAAHFVVRVLEAGLLPPEPDAPPGAARSAAADPLDASATSGDHGDDETAAAGKGGQG